MTEKRSFEGGFARLDLLGDAIPAGVGGRQAKGRVSGGGGGYLENCGISNFRIQDAPPPDPRFDELAKIGIGGPWLRLARRVGFDAFLEIWRAISEDEGVRHDGGRRMPKLREFSAYQRFQRNQYVRSLAAGGMDPQQVRKLVEKNLGERLSIRHIQGVMNGAYNRAEFCPYENGKAAPDDQDGDA
jgi:hypothetical protein